MISNTTHQPITVMLVDDHPVVLTGYRRLLESTMDISVIAEANDGETGYILYQTHEPDVVILDLNMVGIDGLETMRRIRAKSPEARILIFSMHINETLVLRALKLGAAGYLTKHCGAKQMIQAIRQVKQGQKYIDPELASSIAISLTMENSSEDPLNSLSAREFQIFKLMAEGNSCAQIAGTLTISPKTVGVHHTNIMKKLKLNNSSQLVRLAINCDIIQV
ncbi:two component transcriptional regulator, LuxR family [Nitrosomonas cryotolerans]|uniref:Two component transcriptional regulator, LuxR family n=1 Tax=Nitrosomonas cryotolerans ATCC 49181 TaxID=1131553 RepID=A0A1N6J2J2_9PROT|nr:response regulator transcription factor [Nitrosomonas cryotolerans]SFP92936.1 two component transcriptional regulator, LuxR family [Nitrosomonas cryotolerans]SIO38465.1 two component transcriptional regulator, LuxR family [Nitrosomonas cryotolerans ATCC 49181]